jgi:hypothetical protein
LQTLLLIQVSITQEENFTEPIKKLVRPNVVKQIPNKQKINKKYHKNLAYCILTTFPNKQQLHFNYSTCIYKRTKRTFKMDKNSTPEKKEKNNTWWCNDCMTAIYFTRFFGVTKEITATDKVDFLITKPEKIQMGWYHQFTLGNSLTAFN